MMDRERWNGQSPCLPLLLHPSTKIPINIPMDIRVGDQGKQENIHIIMEDVCGYGYHAAFFSVFESTGDSEVDARPTNQVAVVMEVDDAESCSYDDLELERSEEGFCQGDGEGVNAAEDEEEGDNMRRDETRGGGGGGFCRYKSAVGWWS